jgi:hypothetical protein
MARGNVYFGRKTGVKIGMEAPKVPFSAQIELAPFFGKALIVFENTPVVFLENTPVVFLENTPL